MKQIAVIGGDLRVVKLIEMLAKDNIIIKVYALENAESLKKISQVYEAISIEDAIKGVETIISSFPLSSNGIHINTPFSNKNITLEELTTKLNGKTLIAGGIQKEFYQLAQKQNLNVIDLLKREELVVLNTIATAEGAIQIAMEETIKTIHGSNILVLGFGRIGKTLANMLKGLGANVYCEARKEEDLAWIKIYGYNSIKLCNLKSGLNKFDIIINTIPSLILKREEISCLKKDCVVIDLASSPGGIDIEEAKKQGIKTIWALALPGKVAPFTSAEFIKETLYEIEKEGKL